MDFFKFLYYWILKTTKNCYPFFLFFTKLFLNTNLLLNVTHTLRMSHSRSKLKQLLTCKNWLQIVCSSRLSKHIILRLVRSSPKQNWYTQMLLIRRINNNPFRLLNKWPVKIRHPVYFDWADLVVQLFPCHMYEQVITKSEERNSPKKREEWSIYLQYVMTNKKVNSRLTEDSLMGYRRKTFTCTPRYFSNFIFNKQKKRPERKWERSPERGRR
jgi:hypothetical protein